MRNKSRLPPNIAKGKTHGLEFHISPAMLERFVDLTGDRSALHTDRAFARKSMYGEKVVHGILPLVFISALKPFYLGEFQGSFEQISAKFLKPAFVSDRLLISSKISEVDQEHNKLVSEYVLKNRLSGAILTTGNFTIQFTDSAADKNQRQQSDSLDLQIPMIMDPLVEKDLQFHEIDKNVAGSFRFKISESHTHTLYEILSEGLTSRHQLDFSNWTGYCNTTNLLTTCLLSTFAGMCIPGRYATLMTFQVTFEKPIQMRKDYMLNGKVAFKSQSTSTLIEDISIHQCDSKETPEAYATAKMYVKVNEPPAIMPSVEFLRQNELDLQLKDKVVLITGASRGIGETTAKLFSLHGARVVINYFQGAEEADRIVNEIRSNGGNAVAVQADVSDRKQVNQMVTKVCKDNGTIHILVNNAVRNAYPISFIELTWEELQRDINVTVKGAFNCCKAVIPLMLKSNGGKIVNISTVYTEIPPPNQAKYVISKSALVGLTRSLAAEFAHNNIQVNMVIPSIVETDLTRHVSKIFLEGMKNETPMKRNATPADVAKAVVFLASSASSFTTGQKIMVTGGNPPFL